MRNILPAIFLATTASAVHADDYDCADLWFSRNAMWNDAGYCFSSPLGQAVFDNMDCTTDTPQLSELNQEFVDGIIEAERELACDVDTSATDFDFERFEHRWAVVTQPVTGPSEFTQWSCHGFVLPKMPVRASPLSSAKLIGWVHTGDGFYVVHEGYGDWAFVFVTKPKLPDLDSALVTRLAGWVSVAHFPAGDYTKTCEVMAG